MMLQPPVASNRRDGEEATGVQVMSDTCKEPFSEGMARAGKRVRPAAQNCTFSGLLARGRASVGWSPERSATSRMGFSMPLMTTVRATHASDEAVAELHRSLRQRSCGR